jgi:lysozyme
MIYSKTGLALTEAFEGVRLVAYQDSGGVWTIGYGHTHGVYPGMACLPQQAFVWLQSDMMDAQDAVNQLVTVALTQPEFDSLTDFVFNIGATAFARSTLLRLLNAGDYANAANEFERWDLCKGQVVAGLMRRRQAEKAEFNQTLQT